MDAKGTRARSQLCMEVGRGRLQTQCSHESPLGGQPTVDLNNDMLLLRRYRAACVLMGTVSTNTTEHGGYKQGSPSATVSLLTGLQHTGHTQGPLAGGVAQCSTARKQLSNVASVSPKEGRAQWALRAPTAWSALRGQESVSLPALGKPGLQELSEYSALLSPLGLNHDCTST